MFHFKEVILSLKVPLDVQTIITERKALKLEIHSVSCKFNDITYMHLLQYDL